MYESNQPLMQNHHTIDGKPVLRTTISYFEMLTSHDAGSGRLHRQQRL